MPSNHFIYDRTAGPTDFLFRLAGQSRSIMCAWAIFDADLLLSQAPCQQAPFVSWLRWESSEKPSDRKSYSAMAHQKIEGESLAPPDPLADMIPLPHRFKGGNNIFRILQHFDRRFTILKLFTPRWQRNFLLIYVCEVYRNGNGTVLLVIHHDDRIPIKIISKRLRL